MLRPALLCLALLLGACAPQGPLAPRTPLRDLAPWYGLHIGTSVDEDAFAADPRYRQVMAREFSILTPENALKFERVHPAPQRYDFGKADAIAEFAAANGIAMHGHTLLWHQQLPPWLTRGGYTPAQLKAILREHIHTVVGHYRGRIPLWDVVSEAFDEEGRLRETFWLRGIGPDYIALAFQWAHEADPQAVLLYNDYANEGINRKSDAIYRLVSELRSRDVPVHGVGMQMHLSTDYVPESGELARNMRRLEELGIEVHITEMDVRLRLPAGGDARARQALIYRAMLDACLAADNCKSFALWGFTDRYSWIPTFFPGWGAALPFDEDYRPKPAYHTLVERLRRRD
jgi:endo-1,4-beta-xylanase